MVTDFAASLATSPLLLSLAPIATVVAAIITGFGAAILKRRWDVDTESTRWLREANSRLRQERLDAFGIYLAARPNLAAVSSSLRSSLQEYVDLDGMFSLINLAGIRLLILLENEADAQVIEQDLEEIRAWMSRISRSISNLPEQEEINSPEDLIRMARRIAAPG